MPRENLRPTVPAALMLLALVASLLPLLATGSAAAAPPVPDKPSFGAGIEGYAAYEGNTVCDPVNRPGAKKLAKLIRATYGSDESIGIARNSCYTPSEHNDGRALDWMIDTSKKAEKNKADTFLSWLLATDKRGNRHAMARRLGVMYIIFNKRMWRAYDPGAGWSPYTGTNPHTDHIHISLSYDGSSGRSSFWTGKPLAGACTTAALTESAPPVVTDPMKFVPVTATRVAATASGTGMVNGRCRLFASNSYTSRRVDVPVSGVSSIPRQGVASVALQVTMRRPNWNSYLTAGPAGGKISGVHQLTTAQNKSSSSLLVLPVGADGKVSFRTNMGATDLAVSVVGYYVDPGAPLRIRRKITAGGGDTFDPVTPKRLYSGVKLGSSGRFKAEVAGRAGTDPASSAAVVSVSLGKGSGHGSLYVYAAGAKRPKLPLISYGRGAQTVQTVVPIGRSDSIVVENSGSNARTVDLDVVGAYEPVALPGGRPYAARRVPKAVVDTTSGLGFSHLSGGKSKDFSVADATPKNASAVLLQVTAKKPKSATGLSFWRPGVAYPGTTDLFIGSGDVVSGTVIASVNDRGMVRVRNSDGAGLGLKITVLGSYH
jgi:hypothetical protein